LLGELLFCWFDIADGSLAWRRAVGLLALHPAACCVSKSTTAFCADPPHPSLPPSLNQTNTNTRALARKNGYQLEYNREIIGLGLANFAGAAFSSYTTTGSFSRSAVNNASGAKTQLAGFFTSIVVLLVLLFLTPVFSKLPYNTIGAIIIVGVCQLIEFGVAHHLFKTHIRDFLVWLVAFLCTMFLGVEMGLAISIGLALLIVVFESAFPHTAVLGQVNDSAVYRSIEQYPDAKVVPGVLVVRLDAPA